ncbi:MAG: hypothetical protein AB7I38_18760 [Dehalococcoidia bacterium]
MLVDVYGSFADDDAVVVRVAAVRDVLGGCVVVIIGGAITGGAVVLGTVVTFGGWGCPPPFPNHHGSHPPDRGPSVGVQYIPTSPGRTGVQ